MNDECRPWNIGVENKCYRLVIGEGKPCLAMDQPAMPVRLYNPTPECDINSAEYYVS